MLVTRSNNYRQTRAILMRRPNWLKNTIGAIIIVPLFAALAGCGGGITELSGTGGGGGGGATLKSATVAWNQSTTNSDGSPLLDLAGYRVYYGTSSGDYTTTVEISDPSATSTVIDNLPVNTTYYFALTAYDNFGNESAFSNEGVKTL